MPTLLLLGSGSAADVRKAAAGLSARVNTGFGKLLAINDLTALGADPLCRMNHLRRQVNKLRHSEISTSIQAVIKSMLEDLERTIQILQIDICTEEERVRVFDKVDPLYSALARALTFRRDNLIVTVADLEKRLVAIAQAIPASMSEAA